MKNTNKKSKSIARVIRVAFTLTAVIVSAPVPSYADYPHPTGAVTVQHAKSNQRINMFERRNGGKVILHPPDNSIDQNLWIEKNPDNSTFSLWVDNTYARLSTKSDPTRDGIGTEVWMSGAKGSPQQTLRAIPRSGYPGQFLLEFQINGRGTGKCLDATGGANYVQPIIWGCNNGNDNQGFSISQRGGSPAPNPSPAPVQNLGQPNFSLPVYTTDNIFWKAGYAPASTYPNPAAGASKGNCTWYANGRARQLGRNTNNVNKLSGNAFQWGIQARNAGLTTSNTPQVGAIAQWDAGAGHVAVVESVNNDGTITISESSYATPGTAGDFLYRTRVISASNPTRYIIP